MFFFFKQKTAYEMRISDWSSDVCSSDLLPGIEGTHLDAVFARCEVGRQRSAPQVRRWLGFGRTVVTPQRFRQVVAHVLDQQARVGLRHPPHRHPVTTVDAILHARVVAAHENVEMGRAACGEWGCQYVKIWVVAVSLKKKK